MAAGRPSTSKDTSDRLSLMSCISLGASTRKSKRSTRAVLPSAIGGRDDEQIACVIVECRGLAERIGVALRQVEMLARVRREAGNARADPILAVTVGRGKADRKRRAAQIAAVRAVVQSIADVGSSACPRTPCREGHRSAPACRFRTSAQAGQGGPAERRIGHGDGVVEKENACDARPTASARSRHRRLDDRQSPRPASPVDWCTALRCSA